MEERVHFTGAGGLEKKQQSQQRLFELVGGSVQQPWCGVENSFLHFSDGGSIQQKMNGKSVINF
jgi:hypothetical protein